MMTEKLSYSKNLLWKSNTFIFENLSQFAELDIEVYSADKQFVRYEGIAKISMVLLNLDQINKVNFFHEYIRDEKLGQVGQLIIGYQNIRLMKSYAHSLEKNRAENNSE